MKTVFDAVIEFKGETPYNMKFIINKKNLKDDNNGFYVASFVHCGYATICTREEFNQLVDEMATNYGTSEAYSDYKVNYKMINDDMKPVSPPTFTQSMADAGTLPSVGMEVMITEDSDADYFKATIKYISSFTVVYDRGVNSIIEDSLCMDECWIKPLTPPIELIDGKAYQFEYEGQTRYAPYNKSINFFSDVDKHINPDSCTNIQLLEVKS